MQGGSSTVGGDQAAAFCSVHQNQPGTTSYRRSSAGRRSGPLKTFGVRRLDAALVSISLDRAKAASSRRTPKNQESPAIGHLALGKLPRADEGSRLSPDPDG